MKHTGVASWFRRLCTVQPDFVSRERIVWVDIKGVPLNAWSRNTFSRISSRCGEVIDLEDCTEDSFARKRICIKTSQENNILERFKVIVRGKIFVLRAKELFAWSPSFKAVKDIEYCSDNYVNKDDIANSDAEDNYEAEVVESDDDYVSNTKFDDQEVNMKHGFTEKCSSAEKESGIQLTFSPRFTPDKDECQDDVPNNDHGDAGVKSLIRSHSEDLSPRVMEDAQPINAHESNKGGKDPISGGSILEVLENMIKVGNAMGFSMEGSRVQDQKDWIKELNNKNKVNFLSIQETKMDCISNMEVKALWGNHKFEFIISEAVGDRMGIVFNAHGAKDFNRFISNSGLVELQLEGFSFTWSHPSAKKM
nr:RNA-directed DNA polymerase, eukaryota [Tanacetum cinerariifolium]